MILVVARMEKPSIIAVAFVVGLLTWSGTARGIRSQVLSIRERSYAAVARANGESELEVLFREVMPNLLPLMMASFIGAVTAGIGIVMALEVLGLGNNVIPTLGMMIFWSQRFSAVLRGMYWWWTPPIVTIAGIFIGLFFLSQGLDRYITEYSAKPKAKKTVSCRIQKANYRTCYRQSKRGTGSPAGKQSSSCLRNGSGYRQSC